MVLASSGESDDSSWPGPHDPLLDAGQAAEFLGLSPYTVRHWARARKIPAVKLGKLWKFRESSLRAWIECQERPAK